MIDRRRFLALSSSAGFTSLLVSQVLGRSPEDISPSVIAEAEKLAGLTFSEDDRKLMEKAVRDHEQNYEKLRAVPLANDVPPALRFSPLLPGRKITGQEEGVRPSRVDPRRVSTAPEDIPYLSIPELGALLRSHRLTSVDLTRLYLERLRRGNEKLACVITFTEGRALEEARRADEEIRRGRYRGPLHGIPYGLKDLFAARGYPTTWGSVPFKDQVIDADAAVVERLGAAGAVLLAKTAVGELAWGDVWFGGTTKSPWNLEQGSSGSSAGSASATAAGLVGFAIGTETLGSIISPSHRCGATGLRPTFGRVSRHGVMALSWSMDKVGPLCRYAEDCLLVLDAIRGSDGRDPVVLDAPLNWDARRNPRELRLGFDAAGFDRAENPHRTQEQAALGVLRDLGWDLVPVVLPDLPAEDMMIILEAEAAAAFDVLTRQGGDDLMVRQEEQAWPNVFRAARLIPAVEYVQANRARTVLMERFEKVFENVDLYVHPTYGGATLLAANLTGHPTLIVRNAFAEDGMPTSLCFTGKLFAEADLGLVGKAFQDRTGFHLRRPEF